MIEQVPLLFMSGYSILSYSYLIAWLQIILLWAAMPSSGGSSQPRNQTQVSHAAGRFFTVWATRDATGVGCQSLLQGIFPTKGSNPGLPCCRQILYQLSYQGMYSTIIWHLYTLQSNHHHKSSYHPSQCSWLTSQCQTLFWGAPKSLQMVIASRKLKDPTPWKESYDQPR